MSPHHRSETYIGHFQNTSAKSVGEVVRPPTGRQTALFFCYDTAPSTGARQKYHLVRWFLIEPDKPVVESTHSQVTAGKPPGFYFDI